MHVAKDFYNVQIDKFILHLLSLNFVSIILKNTLKYLIFIV